MSTAGWSAVIAALGVLCVCLGIVLFFMFYMAKRKIASATAEANNRRANETHETHETQENRENRPTQQQSNGRGTNNTGAPGSANQPQQQPPRPWKQVKSSSDWTTSGSWGSSRESGFWMQDA